MDIADIKACQLLWYSCQKIMLYLQRSQVLALHFVLRVMCAGSYDGEILVWNSNTETVLRKLHPHKEGT